jgi:hypothetical protein
MKKKLSLDQLKAEYHKALDRAPDSEARMAVARELRAELVDELTKGISTERVEQLCAAEREGRAVVLPAWGNVFVISGGEVQEMHMCHYRGNAAGIYDMRCECADQFEDCDRICRNENEKACAYNFRVAEIGKTVFLTREAAEAAKGVR